MGQPTALDPSRAPEGKAILWLQLPEAPRFIKSDAAGQIPTPPDGRWTETVREAFADRVEALLSRHIEDFPSLPIARKVYSPADLESLNVNLVRGDPYGGSGARSPCRSTTAPMCPGSTTSAPRRIPCRVSHSHSR